MMPNMHEKETTVVSWSTGLSWSGGGIIFAATGHECVFGLRWVDGLFGICIGPFMIAIFKD